MGVLVKSNLKAAGLRSVYINLLFEFVLCIEQPKEVEQDFYKLNNSAHI